MAKQIHNYANNKDILNSIIDEGNYLILSDFTSQHDLYSLIVNELYGIVKSLTQKTSDNLSLEKLHEVLSPLDVATLRDRFLIKMRPHLFKFACKLGRDILGLKNNFYVDDYVILRVNFPYEVAKTAQLEAENPGIGRVSQSQQSLAKSISKKDPNYSPHAVHGFEPPAAWAHGPHQDTWTGHSHRGINIWWAISNVEEENSMVFYPSMFGKTLAPDVKSLYLKSGFALPRPLKMAMNAGELLIFNPELLHGTHLNISSSTRVAISLRINPEKPSFNPDCFYAREFWQSSNSIEQNLIDHVERFPRESNLNTAFSSIKIDPPSFAAFEVERGADNFWYYVCMNNQINNNEKFLIKIKNNEIIIAKSPSGNLQAFSAQCPHLNVSLMDGMHDEESIYCPMHAVNFSLKDGKSKCDLLNLKIHALKEINNEIWIYFNNTID